jgi:hypothetical protein
MPKPDGGPAFPKPDVIWNGDYVYGPFGMSLRQWYAGMAMQSIFGGIGAQIVANRDSRYDETNWAEVVAKNSFEMADAMIAESEKNI